MTTRIGLGSILGQLRHLPIEIIARINEEANLTKRLEKISRWVNHWVIDVNGWIVEWREVDDAFFWVLNLVKGVRTIRRNEHSIRRLRE